MPRPRLNCLAAISMSLVSPWLFAQQSAAQGPPAPAAAPPATTITVNASLVNLPVIVRDKKGAIIQNLTKSDFALSVDGHPQTIRYFDKDSDLPLTLGLLVDVSGSVRSALGEEQSASEAFLDQMLRSTPDAAPRAPTPTPDKAFLIQFAHETELLRNLTSSHAKLREALNELGTAPPDQATNDGSNSGGSYGGRGGHRGGGGTTLYDAIYLAGNDLMQKQQGRKAIVVLTDGEDRGSKETLASAVAAAQRAETVVYAIYFKGEQHGYGGGRGGGFGGHGGGFPGGGYPGGGGGRGGEEHVDGKKVLEQITGETGGRMFEISGKNNFAAIYSQIAEELRSQYRLGFTPDAAGAEEGLHRVDLTLPKQAKLIVQTRDAYFTGH